MHLSFAQQIERSNDIINSNDSRATISEISASPNPCTVQSRINFISVKSQLIEFSVKNLLGKTVYSERINSKSGTNSIIFQRNNLPNGMYIYSLQTENEIISKRLVIK